MNCPDCEDAKRLAYSDATTPGFFRPYCSKHAPESEIVTALARDLEADATNAPTDLSRLAWQIGLEGRVRGVIQVLKDNAVSPGAQLNGKAWAYADAIDLLERALVGDGEETR